MLLTQEQCFEIAAKIVQQHNKDDLVLIFEGILVSVFPGHEITRHNIINHSLAPDITINRALLEQCLKTHSSQFDDIKSSFAFPVSSLGRITSLISISGPALKQNLTMLRLLIDLFNSQQLLLDNSNHDTLTGLLNRHSFEQRLTSVVDQYQRRGNENTTRYCFAILDIDFFKKVNDGFGHLYGDEVLILFANIMETTFRHDDMLFRYGGEEFAVLLRDIDLDTALLVLNRFREAVASYDFPQVGTITVSIGVCEIIPGTSRRDIIGHADQALYYSKSHGRNQVNSYEALITVGELSEQANEVDDIELF